MVTKVLLVDDHPLILSALAAMIQAMDSEIVVVTAESAQEGHDALLREGDVDLVLLDLMLPDADGFDTLERMRTEHPVLPVVVLSAVDRQPDVVRTLDLGAMGYVSKRSSNAELHHALSMVMAGGVYVPLAMLGQMGQPPGASGPDEAAAGAAGLPVSTAATPGTEAELPAQMPLPRAYAALGLTSRQSDVLALLLKGLPNKLIARELNLSVETVKDHVAAVLRALGVASRTQAVLAVGRLTQSVAGGGGNGGGNGAAPLTPPRSHRY